MFGELVKCFLIDVINWFPYVLFRSPALPFDQVMDSFFFSIDHSFKDLFDFVAVLMFKFG